METAQNTNSKSDVNYDYSKEPIEIRKVNAMAAFGWLRSGIRDLTVSPTLSISYGLVYAVVGLVLIALSWNKPIYAVGMVTVFYILGPLIAVGLYCMSRHIEAGVKPSWDREGCRALCYNPEGYIGFAIIIGMLVVFWTIVAAVIIAINFNNLTIAGSITETVSLLMENKALYPVIGILFLVGLAFAVLCFMISVISIPLMTHRKVDVVTAMIASAKTVLRNPIAMFLWAAIIVLMIGLGFAFAFIGVAVTLPIIGHASWHVYRETIVDDRVLTAAPDCDVPVFPFLKGKVKV